MNKQRRKRLQAICEQLENLFLDLEQIQEEEQEAYDNLPESIQDSERGEQMYEYADNLGDYANDMQDILDNISEIAYE